MNIREIQDRLIDAETTMRELSDGRVGPAPLRAQQLTYVHTRTDRNGWGKRPGEKDQLLKEDADAHSIFGANSGRRSMTVGRPRNLPRNADQELGHARRRRGRTPGATSLGPRNGRWTQVCRLVQERRAHQCHDRHKAQKSCDEVGQNRGVACYPRNRACFRYADQQG